MASDAASVFAIGQASPEAAQWSLASYEVAVLSGQNIFIVEDDGVACGFLVSRFAGTESEILNMAVAPAHRGKGLGSSLLANASAEAKAKEVERIFLEVRASNQRAISFYEKHEFVKRGIRRSYYRHPDEDAVLMETKLTG